MHVMFITILYILINLVHNHSGHKEIWKICTATLRRAKKGSVRFSDCYYLERTQLRSGSNIILIWETWSLPLLVLIEWQLSYKGSRMILPSAQCSAASTLWVNHVWDQTKSGSLTSLLSHDDFLEASFHIKNYPIEIQPSAKIHQRPT